MNHALNTAYYMQKHLNAFEHPGIVKLGANLGVE